MSGSEPPSHRTDIPAEILALWRKIANLTAESAEDPSALTAGPLSSKSKLLLDTLRALPDSDLLALVRAAAYTQVAKDRLEESEAKFATAFHESPIPMVISTLIGARIIEVNRSFERIIGYSAAEVTGRTALEVGLWYDPADRSHWISELEEHGTVHDVELRFRTRTGSTVICNTTASVVMIGGRRCLLTAVEDVTEQRRVEKQLRESEQRYRSFVENFAGIAYQGKDFVPFFFHGDVAGLTGYTEDDFLAGSPKWNEIVHPDDNNIFATEEERKLHEPGGHTYTREYRIVRKDGAIAWVHENIQSICYESGTYQYVQGTIQDISERKRAEAAVYRSEGRLCAIIRTAASVIISLAPDHRIIEWNEEAEKLFGYSREEVLGQDYIKRFVSPAERSTVARDIQRILRGGQTRGFENAIMTREGTERVLLWNVTSLADDTGQISEIIAIGQDITARARAEAGLKANEQMLHTILESAADGILAVDGNGRVVHANRKFAEMWRLPQELIDLKDDSELVESVSDQVTNPEAFLARVRVLYDSKEDDFDLLRFKDGRVFEIFSRPSMKQDAVVGRVWSFRDVTGSWQAQKQLRAEKERAQRYIDIAQTFLLALDRSGSISLINRKGCDLLGYAESELLGKNWFDSCLPAAERARTMQSFLSVVSGEHETAGIYENFVETKAGEQRLILWHTTLVRGEDDGIIGLLSSGEDVTDRRRTENALRASEQKFRAVFDQSVQLTGLLSLDGIVLEVNQAALELAGVEAADVVGKPYFETPWWSNSSEEQETLRAAFRTAVAGEWAHFQSTHLDATGRTRELDAMIGPLIDEGGEVVGVIPVGFDITGIKRTEQEVMASREALRALTSELASAEERERRRIASDLHDRLGQALAVMRMKFGALTTAADERESRQLIDEIRDLLERAIDDTSTLTFELSPPILYELGVEAAIEWAGEQLCAEHQLEFEFTDDGRRKPLEEDAGPLLYRCARELMMNVVKHAGANSLKVEVGRAGDMVNVAVEDDGSGFVPPEGGEGVGSSSFGLYSIQERIRYLGGTFDIRSEPGSGTKAMVSAPIRSRGNGEHAS